MMIVALLFWESEGGQAGSSRRKSARPKCPIWPCRSHCTVRPSRGQQWRGAVLRTQEQSHAPETVGRRRPAMGRQRKHRAGTGRKRKPAGWTVSAGCSAVTSHRHRHRHRRGNHHSFSVPDAEAFSPNHYSAHLWRRVIRGFRLSDRKQPFPFGAPDRLIDPSGGGGAPDLTPCAAPRVQRARAIAWPPRLLLHLRFLACSSVWTVSEENNDPAGESTPPPPPLRGGLRG